jgi:hypothetical protein
VGSIPPAGTINKDRHEATTNPLPIEKDRLGQNDDPFLIAEFSRLG